MCARILSACSWRRGRPSLLEMPNQGKSVVSRSGAPALLRSLTDRNAPTHIPLTLPECQAELLIELGHQVLKRARKSRDDLDGDFIRYLTIKTPNS